MGMRSAKVLQMPVSDVTLRKRIAQIAVRSENVLLTSHARDRMRKRGVTLPQILATLRKGQVVEPAHLDIRGNWKCTLERVCAGERIKVAAAVQDRDGEKVVVITVMN